MFLLIILLAEGLVGFEKAELANKQRIDTLALSASLRARFERELSSLIYLNSGLGSYLAVKHTNLNDNEINAILAELYHSNTHIKNFGIAIGYRIKYVYPVRGNEKAIGLNYPDLPAQWPGIRKVIESRKPALIGPITLVQGGRGLIYRIPLFIRGQYWGLLSTVINADSLFEASFTAGINEQFQLAIRNGNDVFYGNAALFDYPDSVMQNIAIPDGQWEMAMQKPLTQAQHNLLDFTRAASILLACLISLLSYHLVLSRKKYAQLSTKLGNLYELSPLGIALTDMQGKYVEFNNAFRKICGYTREELNQLDYWELTPREYSEMEAMQLESLRSRGIYGPYEKEYIRKDKSRIPIRLNGLLLRGIDGRDYIWSIVEDISESRKIDKMQNEFVSTISHELRTPMTSIAGALSLITSGKFGSFEPQVQSMLEIANRNSQHLKHLINDLLDMEKLIAGKMSFNIQKHALLPILQSTIESVSAYATQYSVEFVQAGCSENDMVMADSFRLQQVLYNLLSNAAKFSPAGSTIRIDTQRRNDMIRVNVIDHGSGIPEAFRTRIFTKFSQADSSDSRQRGGTGLGLAISKEIIERMHGTIGFMPAEGGGSCFYFELPAEEPCT